MGQVTSPSRWEEPHKDRCGRSNSVVMSAKKTVTENEGTAREAVLRAMQEAAEGAAGKKGAPKGPQGTKGIVILPNEISWASPKDKTNKSKSEDDDDEDEGSEAPSAHPRNLSYSSTSARAPKSPAKRKKKAAWPPRDRNDDEEDKEGAIHEDEDDDDDGDSGSRHSYDGLEIAIDHATLYDWLLKRTKEYGMPGITPLGVFNTLCLDETMDEWLMGIEEANVPNAWADDGWAGLSPGELVCVFTYLTIVLTLGDLAIESGILTPSQSEMFWSYRQTLIYYAADSLVHKIVVDLSRMVRVRALQAPPLRRKRSKEVENPLGRNIVLPLPRMPERSKWLRACVVTVIARETMRLS